MVALDTGAGLCPVRKNSPRTKYSKPLIVARVAALQMPGPTRSTFSLHLLTVSTLTPVSSSSCVLWPSKLRPSFQPLAHNQGSKMHLYPTGSMICDQLPCRASFSLTTRKCGIWKRTVSFTPRIFRQALCDFFFPGCIYHQYCNRVNIPFKSTHFRKKKSLFWRETSYYYCIWNPISTLEHVLAWWQLIFDVYPCCNQKFSRVREMLNSFWSQLSNSPWHQQKDSQIVWKGMTCSTRAQILCVLNHWTTSDLFTHPNEGVGKLQPLHPIVPTLPALVKRFIGRQPSRVIYVFSLAASATQWQTWVVTIETVWATKPKILTILAFYWMSVHTCTDGWMQFVERCCIYKAPCPCILSSFPLLLEPISDTTSLLP